MTDNLPHDWEMSPRYRILDSAIRSSQVLGAPRWQLHLIKQPSWNYSFLWARPLVTSADAGFVALEDRFHNEKIFGAQETLKNLDAQIDSLLGAADALARRFVLNTRGELRRDNQRAHETLIVRRDGVAACNHGQYSEGAEFRWRTLGTPIAGANFIRIPAAQIWDELQMLFADAESEANFARQYARLDPITRRERVQQTARGMLAEFNRLLHDVVLASPQWDDWPGENELFLSLDKSGAARMWEIGRAAPDELETPDFVHENVRTLWNYFQPFDRRIADFLCVRDSDANSLFARAFRPSAHQKLEAQLRLRDWKNSAKT